MQPTIKTLALWIETPKSLETVSANLNNLRSFFENTHVTLEKLTNLLNERNSLDKMDKFNALVNELQKNASIPPEFREVLINKTLEYQKEFIKTQVPAFKEIPSQDTSSYLKKFYTGAYFISRGESQNQYSIHFNSEKGPQSLNFVEDAKGQLICNTIKAANVKELIKKLQSEKLLPQSMTACSDYELAAAKMDAIRKGIQTRENIVLPLQIYPLLQEQLKANDYTDDEIMDISRAICREINTMVSEPDKYKGKSVRVAIDTKYTYPVFSREQYEKSREFSFKHNCWLEMSSDGKEIKLKMSELNDQSLLGRGALKFVHGTHSFEIPFHLEKGERKGIYDPRIIFVPTAKESIPKIIQGLEIQQKILEKVKGVHIAELPVLRTPSADGSKVLPEWNQTFYNADLHFASAIKLIPLGLSKNSGTKEFTFEDALRVLSHVSEAVQTLHNEGCIHRDLKAANILVKNKKEIEGYLGDFDFAREMGVGNPGDYFVWDALSRLGLFTPAVDQFGLAFSLASTISPEYWRVTQDLNDINLKNHQNHLSLAIKDFKNESLKKEPTLQSLMHLLDGSPPLSLEESIKQMEAMPGLSENTKNAFLKLAKTIEAYKMSFQLVWDTFEACRNLYQKLYVDSDFQDIWVTGTIEQKKEAWQKVVIDQKIFPSDEDFCKSLAEIQKLYTS